MKLVLDSCVCLVIFILTAVSTNAQTGKANLDEKVRTYLDKHKSEWHDLNVPYKDGQFLHDLIVKHNYKNALEIGTSTGHSAIWIAWALSKTGGKLITIEIDEERYNTALENFKEAGLSEFIDASLADAHGLVKELNGPFDFVFSDADKDWYKQYFIDIAPKMAAGGCFTAHNVGSMNWPGIRDFVNYIRTRIDFETTIENKETTGISISYKRE